MLMKLDDRTNKGVAYNILICLYSKNYMIWSCDIFNESKACGEILAMDVMDVVDAGPIPLTVVLAWHHRYNGEWWTDFLV